MKSFMFVTTDTVQTVVTNFECLRLIFLNHSIVIGQILTLQRCVRINWLHFEWPSTRKNKIPPKTRYNLSRGPNDFRETATGKLIYTAANFASKLIRFGRARVCCKTPTYVNRTSPTSVTTQRAATLVPIAPSGINFDVSFVERFNRALPCVIFKIFVFDVIISCSFFFGWN